MIRHNLSFSDCNATNQQVKHQNACHPVLCHAPHLSLTASFICACQHRFMKKMILSLTIIRKVLPAPTKRYSWQSPKRICQHVGASGSVRTKSCMDVGLARDLFCVPWMADSRRGIVEHTFPPTAFTLHKWKFRVTDRNKQLPQDTRNASHFPISSS